MLFDNGDQYMRSRHQVRTVPHLKAFAEDVARQSSNIYQKTLSSRWIERESGSISTDLISPSAANQVGTLGALRDASTGSQAIEASTIRPLLEIPTYKKNAEASEIKSKSQTDIIPSPSIAPPGYNELTQADGCDTPNRPVGTILGVSSPASAPKAKVQVSKTTVGVVGVLVGAAFCNVM